MAKTRSTKRDGDTRNKLERKVYQQALRTHWSVIGHISTAISSESCRYFSLTTNPVKGDRL
jgi:hypothetical protein